MYLPSNPNTSRFPVAMVKSHGKKSQNYFRSTVKCRRNVNFEDIHTEPSAGKNSDFLLLRGIFKEYIKQNFIMTVLRKVNSDSVDIYRLIKNQ